MKKLLFFCMSLLLAGCCAIAQIPPQYLYVDETCGAALPDYLSMIEVRDNCGIDTVEMTPTRGSWLTVPVTTVLIEATDNFGNKSNMMFTVTLIDTIFPEFFLADSTLISGVYEKINQVYDMADKMLARQELWFDSNFDYEAVGIPDTLIPFQQYFNKVLLTWTTPMLAYTGQGGRVHTFINTSDTLLIRPKDDAWIGLMK